MDLFWVVLTLKYGVLAGQEAPRDLGGTSNVMFSKQGPGSPKGPKNVYPQNDPFLGDFEGHF
jgi:hypothetical protein